MKTRHGDKKREIMWDSSKPSSTEIVPVLTERNAHSIFTTNCSFCLLRFSHVLYSTHEKYKSCIRTTENSKITALQLHYCSFPFDLMTFARNRKSDILTLTLFYLPWRRLSLKLSLYLYISKKHSHFTPLYTFKDFSRYQFKR